MSNHNLENLDDKSLRKYVGILSEMLDVVHTTITNHEVSIGRLERSGPQADGELRSWMAGRLVDLVLEDMRIRDQIIEINDDVYHILHVFRDLGQDLPHVKAAMTQAAIMRDEQREKRRIARQEQADAVRQTILDWIDETELGTLRKVRDVESG